MASRHAIAVLVADTNGSGERPASSSASNNGPLTHNRSSSLLAPRAAAAKDSHIVDKLIDRLKSHSRCETNVSKQANLRLMTGGRRAEMRQWVPSETSRSSSPPSFSPLLSLQREGASLKHHSRHHVALLSMVSGRVLQTAAGRVDSGGPQGEAGPLCSLRALTTVC